MKGALRCVQTCWPQEEVDSLAMMTDSDFAGCAEARKSTVSWLSFKERSSAVVWGGRGVCLRVSGIGVAGRGGSVKTRQWCVREISRTVLVLG